jgi:hypothetical protein
MLRLLACAVLAFAPAASAQITYMSAYLDGAQEVPPVPSAGLGWGVARFNAATNVVDLYCFHRPLTTALLAAHMHIGAPGVGGGIIVGLNPIAPNTWAGSGTLNASDAATLLAGNMYFNVHTVAFGGGEIRGQIVNARSTRLTAVLNGAQEVPPNASAATGTAVAFLHQPENRIVYAVESTGLVGVFAAHFHVGAVGVNGPIEVPLNGANGIYCGVSDRLTAAQVTTILADGWYVNIHTNGIPTGEIRGQMREDVGDHFFSVADGAQETPPVATAGIASGNITIAPNGTVVLTGAYSGLTGPPALAHVHVGAVGVPGPIVFNLTAAGGAIFGAHIPSPAELADLRAGLWYINLHTAAHPLGEVRGQLLPATLPTTFGEGCPTSLGTRPQCGATGFAAMGSTVVFDLYGSLPAPAGFNIMVIGATRDPPLPVQLPLIAVNAPQCHVLTDIVLTYVAFSDSMGCAHVGLSIPLDPALRNIPLYTEWVTFDAGANPAGIVTSNALTFFVH